MSPEGGGRQSQVDKKVTNQCREDEHLWSIIMVHIKYTIIRHQSFKATFMNVQPPVYIIAIKPLKYNNVNVPISYLDGRTRAPRSRETDQ